ncbi:iron chaperone [Puia sp. P3]|uniref:iron chaperone n=1 Tax=Puia sp. P3 TaxID=3423952 RepID=UPI003D6766A6
MPTKFQTVDEYISTFPPATKKALTEIRSLIQKAAPTAEETISYNIPAFKLDGMLVWYAGYKEHIGLYPKPDVIQIFKKELTNYKLSKGTIQFPLDQPLPVSLITKIVKYRIAENKAAAKTKKSKIK